MFKNVSEILEIFCPAKYPQLSNECKEFCSLNMDLSDSVLKIHGIPFSQKLKVFESCKKDEL